MVHDPLNTQSPLERAANAIEHEFVELADPDGPISSCGIAKRVARAVLEAIREPSEAMLDAGEENGQVPYEPGIFVREAWQAMIDAALEEG